MKSQLKSNTIVVAGIDAQGHAAFLDSGPGFERSREGEIESRWVWTIDEVPDLPASIGHAPVEMAFPGPGATMFGLVCFPAHSAGRRRLDGEAAAPGMHADGYADPSMHRTDTVDYEVVISGRIDIELPHGESRTLEAGDCLVMGGVGHAWKNHYDEPCVYAVVTVGARGTVTAE